MICFGLFVELLKLYGKIPFLKPTSVISKGFKDEHLRNLFYCHSITDCPLQESWENKPYLNTTYVQ